MTSSRQDVGRSAIDSRSAASKFSSERIYLTNALVSVLHDELACRSQHQCTQDRGDFLVFRLDILGSFDLYVCNDRMELYARNGYTITRRISKFEQLRENLGRLQHVQALEGFQLVCTAQ